MSVGSFSIAINKNGLRGDTPGQISGDKSLAGSALSTGHGNGQTFTRYLFHGWKVIGCRQFLIC
jgi:hypothetical protein